VKNTSASLSTGAVELETTSCTSCGRYATKRDYETTTQMVISTHFRLTPEWFADVRLIKALRASRLPVPA